MSGMVVRDDALPPTAALPSTAEGPARCVEAWPDAREERHEGHSPVLSRRGLKRAGGVGCRGPPGDKAEIAGAVQYGMAKGRGNADRSRRPTTSICVWRTKAARVW